LAPPPCQISPPSVQPQNRPLSKLSTGGLACAARNAAGNKVFVNGLRSPYATGPLSVLSVCLSVCDVGVLRPTVGTVVGLEPRPHCIRWVPSSTPKAKGHSPASSPEFSAHVCFGQTAGMDGSPQIPLRMFSSLAGRRAVRDQIPLHYPAYDQLASRSATSSRAASSWTKTCVCTSCACRTPNSITLSSSLAGRRPVRDQIRLRCPACDQLASRSATTSRAGRRPVIWQLR